MTTELDHRALNSFYDDLGRDPVFMSHIVALYRVQVEEFCREATRGSKDELANLAHKLAGASSQFGLDQVTEAARRLEAELLAGRPSDEDLHFLQRALPHVADLLEGWVARLPEEPPGP